jgi:ribosomal protein S18 acetylase RimI-like enzyme
MITIESLSSKDWPGVWALLEPTCREGETFAYPRDITIDQAHALWVQAPVATFVAQDETGNVVGSYFIKPNQPGLGSHVCNAGYVVGPRARGRGVAATMCEHSQREAQRRGFRAMQFNFVVSTNEPAVHLWQKLGFEIVGRLPGAYNHARLAYVDAYVMFKQLTTSPGS